MNYHSRYGDACEGSVKMARGCALTLFSLIAAVPPTPQLVALAFLSSPTPPKRSTSISPLITRIRVLPWHQSRGVGTTVTSAIGGGGGGGGGASEHAQGSLARKTVILRDSSRQGCTRPTDQHANVRSPRSTTLTLLHSSRTDSSRDGGDATRDRSNLEVVDPESLARAREAAKNDDYDWFMEFIGEGHDDRLEKENQRARTASIGEGRRNSTAANDLKRPVSTPGRRSARRGTYGDDFGSSGYHNRDGIDVDMYSDGDGFPPSRNRSPPRDRRVRSPSGQRFQTYGRGPREGREIRATAADTAYDYDFDEEFDTEEGRGGWEYDPEFMSNRRRVDLDRVRARARMPVRRAPPEEGFDKKGTVQEEGAAAAAAAAAVVQEGRDEVNIKHLDAAKMKTLVDDLGYTQEEVSRIDPEMADLAISRGIRCPASGMPRDWLSSDASGDSKDYDEAPGEGAPELDLDEILYGARETKGGTRRERPQPSGRSVRRESRYYDDEYYYGDDGDYDQIEDYDDEGYYRRREGRRSGERRDTYDVDRQPPLPARDRRVSSRAGRGRARRKRELDPAEAYERRLFGRGEGDGIDAEDNIWTGIGPDGPWPTFEEFTQLLRDETDLRLSLVGPWATEIVSLENAFRLKAYKAWLGVLEKGIGETLLESGFFDATLTSDDDYDEGGNNLYDTYTDYKSRRSAPAAQGYDYRGRDDERGFDYNGSRYGEDNERFPRRGRRVGGEKLGTRSRGREENFDLGNILRKGAESLMQPAAGMEEQAARFEREYPGRRRRTPDAKENVDVPVNQRSVRKSKDRGGAGRDYDGRVINRSSSYGKSTVTDGYLGGSEDDYDLDD